MPREFRPQHNIEASTQKTSTQGHKPTQRTGLVQVCTSGLIGFNKASTASITTCHVGTEHLNSKSPTHPGNLCLEDPTWRFMGSYNGSFKGPFKGIYRDSIRV